VHRGKSGPHCAACHTPAGWLELIKARPKT
jgi:mono/diheme cytochrome c family protein